MEENKVNKEAEQELEDENSNPSEQFWRCEQCSYEDHKKRMPPDRETFYSRKESMKCPKCKSIGFVPVGY